MTPVTAINQYQTPPSRRGTRRVLTVRMLAARSGWLDGVPHWQDDRVVWVNGTERSAATAADLALAQRSHYRIRRYPISAELALGDHAVWQQRRAQRLALAKQLAALRVPDIAAVARLAQRGDAAALTTLVTLLVAEAVCANALPVSPAHAVAQCLSSPQRAEPTTHAKVLDALGALVSAQDTDPAARALAALTLAAGGAPLRPALDPWCARASAWGRRHGLPHDPAPLVWMLAAESGTALAERLTAAQQAAGPLALTDSQLRTSLAAGTAPAALIMVAEALSRWQPLLDRVVGRPGAAARTAVRVADAAVVIQLLQETVQATGHAAAVDALHALISAQLELTARGQVEIGAITEPARLALGLLGPDAAGGFALLTEFHPQIWDLTTFKRNKRGNNLGPWVENRTSQVAMPLLQQLAQLGDPALLLEAEQLGVRGTWSSITDRAIYQQLLALVQVCDPAPHVPGMLATIARDTRQELAQILIWRFGRRTRWGLLPLLHPIAVQGPHPRRSELLSGLIEELDRSDHLTRDALTRLARHTTAFAARARSTNYGYTAAWTVRAALLADRCYPALAFVWLGWLAGELLRLEQLDEAFPAGSVSVAALFAVALSGGDTARFQAIFQTAIQHRYPQEQELLEESLEQLPMQPGLRAALAQVFAQQPQRCADLLLRVGAARRLGPGALEPLHLLDPAGTAGGAAFVTAEPAWAAALRLAPDLAEPAARLWYAQWVLGAEPQLPTGVQQALAAPQKLLRELTHLDALIAQQPERAGLVQRRANLAARLGAEDALLRGVRAEALERLCQSAALTQLAAAEALVADCYRRRLAQLVGRLPAELELTDDMFNAVQLSMQISTNRRLLRGLIRAHIAREPDWRSGMPGNAAFLARLAAAGVTATDWLAPWPQRVRVSGVAGNALRLRLETDPLRVLQMGNPFGTCLSAGAINAFSTVANAVDLNKRVVFGYDNDGRVVARVLIGLTAEMQLVRFRCYVADELTPVRDAVVRALLGYLRRFAARCGLETADSGDVPRLVSESWYDDGCLSWEPETEAPPSDRTTRRTSDGTPPAYRSVAA